MSGLGGDLEELQSALKAAGLPPMLMKEGVEETDVETSTQDYPSIDVNVEDTKVSPSSAAAGDSESPPLAGFNGGHSEPVVEQEAMSSAPVGQEVGLDLKEAIRAIASEELASISKEILKQGKHSGISQKPFLVTNSTSAHSKHRHDEERSEKGKESSVLKDGSERSQTTYEGLETFSEPLAQVEHTRNQETAAKGSKKPSSSNLGKSSLAAPKMSSKVSSSKKGPASSTDSKVSSRIKVGVQTHPTNLSSSARKDSLKDASGPRPVAVLSKVNRTTSAAAARGQAKPKTRSQTLRQNMSLKSAPAKQPSTKLKQVGGSASKSSSQTTRHKIVVPTGSSTDAMQSPDSDSEDNERIQAASKSGKRTDEGHESKTDAWKKALQEEKVPAIFTDQY